MQQLAPTTENINSENKNTNLPPNWNIEVNKLDISARPVNYAHILKTRMFRDTDQYYFIGRVPHVDKRQINWAELSNDKSRIPRKFGDLKSTIVDNRQDESLESFMNRVWKACGRPPHLRHHKLDTGGEKLDSLDWSWNFYDSNYDKLQRPEKKKFLKDAFKSIVPELTVIFWQRQTAKEVYLSAEIIVYDHESHEQTRQALEPSGLVYKHPTTSVDLKK
jgi:hypothetical protein